MADATGGSRPLAGAGVVLGLLVFLALAAPWLASERPWLGRLDGRWVVPALGADWDTVIVPAPVPHDPASLALAANLSPPSREHLLGTDVLGRDVAARLIHGARTSLAVGLWTAAFALALGLPLGAAAGYLGGWVDRVVSRCIEATLCLPTLVLALALLALTPGWLRAVPDTVRIALVVAVTAWTPVARYLRAEFMRLRASPMVDAARSTGAGGMRIALRHILPSALAPVLVTTAFAVGGAILAEATLSFLGLGIGAGRPTWGAMLLEARDHVDTAWWLTLFPGLALFLAVAGCAWLGEGVRDLLDPRAAGRGARR